MLEYLVINACGDVQFVSSIVSYISHELIYDINITYYKSDILHGNYDVVLFFPIYEDVCEVLELKDKDSTLDINIYVEEELSRSYRDIKFQYYISVFRTKYKNNKGEYIERRIICSNNSNMDDPVLCFEQGGDYPLPGAELGKSIRLFITERLNSIVASRDVESERDKHASISHSIEFSPQHYQAGLGILNYFGTVVRHRYPDIPVLVRIEQEGITVRMVIQTSEGHRETVEHTLQAYGLVIAGKMLPEELLSDPFHVLELKHKLELAQTELRMEHDLLQMADRQYQDQERRLLSLETEMVNMRQLIGDSLQTVRGAQQHTQELTGMLQPLLTNLTTQHDTAVQQALATLSGVIERVAIERGITTQDEQTGKEALVTLQQKDPGVLRQMLDLLGKGAITGTAGRLLYDWLMHMNVILR